MGRPKKEIDKKTFENLCGLQCTKEEICDFLETSDKTLEAWCKRTYNAGFSEVFRQNAAEGKYRCADHSLDLLKSLQAWLYF